MHTHQPPVIVLPGELADDTVAQLIALLHDITEALEAHYAGQLLRYHHPPDDRQRELFDERDPPF